MALTNSKAGKKKEALSLSSSPKPWFVYLLRCSNGCLYTGITTDVKKRLLVHNEGKGSVYVRSHRPAKLVASCPSPSRSKASKMEYYVKSLSKSQKLALSRKWKAGIFEKAE